MNLTADLMNAIQKGDRNRVEQILTEHPAMLHANSESGDSALLLSIYHGRKEIGELLLARGAVPNLHESAALGQVERVRALLADQPQLVHSFSHDGFTPLHLAVFFGHQSLAEELLDRGADISAPSRNQTFARGVTPLHSALGSGHDAIARMLVERGADVNATDADGGTPIFNAAFRGNQEMVQLLLDRHAALDRRHQSGLTPLGIALKNNHPAVADILRSRGAPE